jgi:replicative DNA helicase
MAARRGTLEQIGGRDYLIELHESVPSAITLSSTQIVRDKALLREQSVQRRDHTDCLRSGRACADILDHAEKKLFDVTESASPISPFQCRFWRPLCRSRPPSGDHHRSATGFNALDDLLGGMQFGDLLVVAAAQQARRLWASRFSNTLVSSDAVCLLLAGNEQDADCPACSVHSATWT